MSGPPLCLLAGLWVTVQGIPLRLLEPARVEATQEQIKAIDERMATRCHDVVARAWGDD
jgi:hypothetical protein